MLGIGALALEPHIAAARPDGPRWQLQTHYGAHPMATELDIKRLDKKITALSKALANLGKGTDGKDLLLIIRKPGWTTIAELGFTNAMLDTAAIQLRALETTMAGLKNAAAKVGGKAVTRKAAPKKAAKPA
jgi:hypothetical protein